MDAVDGRDVTQLAPPFELLPVCHVVLTPERWTAVNSGGVVSAVAQTAQLTFEGIDAGWANTGARDLAFLDAMLGRIEGELCVDESRIFSTGWSHGGMMSLAIGCARGDVFRAIVLMSGALYSGCEDGDAPVAFLGYHGTVDDVVPYANGVTARDVFVQRNGCQPEQAAVEANGCLRFEGCAEGAPVTWCEFNGGHTPGPGSEQAIWDFFSQF